MYSPICRFLKDIDYLESTDVLNTSKYNVNFLMKIIEELDKLTILNRYLVYICINNDSKSDRLLKKTVISWTTTNIIIFHFVRKYNYKIWW